MIPHFFLFIIENMDENYLNQLLGGNYFTSSDVTMINGFVGLNDNVFLSSFNLPPFKLDIDYRIIHIFNIEHIASIANSFAQ